MPIEITVDVETAQQLVIIGNIQSTIRRLKKEGTVGMSVENLQMITPTKGVTIHPNEYRQVFPTLAHAAVRPLRGFSLRD